MYKTIENYVIYELHLKIIQLYFKVKSLGLILFETAIDIINLWVKNCVF